MIRYLLLTIILSMSIHRSEGQYFYGNYKLYERAMISYHDERNYLDAINLFNQFEKDNKEIKYTVDVYYYRGLSYYKLGHFKEAIKDLKRSIDFNHPNEGNIHWFIGNAYRGLGKQKEAKLHYALALSMLVDEKSQETLSHALSDVTGNQRHNVKSKVEAANILVSFGLDPNKETDSELMKQIETLIKESGVKTPFLIIWNEQEN